VDVDLALPWILRVHEPAYVQEVRTAFARRQRALDRGETPVLEDTYPVALHSAAGALSLLGAVARGELRNGFAAVRPPGHHAGPSFGRGFCVFNNAASCARFAQQQFGLGRVLILDWDVHPADGTYAIFYEDPSVVLLSVHQDGIFSSNVGTLDQRGRGPGEGSKFNLPLPKGTRPLEYFRALEPVLEAAAELARPDIVIVSCGFDAHLADPVQAMQLDDDAFRRLTRMALQIARHYCAGRLVSILEGGYSPMVLRRCVRSHLELLLD
jgi:acetoin utilization deacetylase AcuC-like enzyme